MRPRKDLETLFLKHSSTKNGLSKSHLITKIFYICNRIEATLSKTYEKKKKRYAYLVNWKPRKFRNYAQGWHSGSHAIAWTAITTFVRKVFLGPPIQNVALQFHASVFLLITSLELEKKQTISVMGFFDLFQSRNSSKSVEKQIYDSFENAIKSVFKKYHNHPLVGLFIEAAIVSKKEELQKNTSLLLASGLTKAEYERLLSNMARKMHNTYLEPDF